MGNVTLSPQAVEALARLLRSVLDQPEPASVALTLAPNGKGITNQLIVKVPERK